MVEIDAATYTGVDNIRELRDDAVYAPAAAKKKILDNIHNGAVILLHPTSATNAAILGEVIREMRAQGYRFGNLDELTGVNDRG